MRNFILFVLFIILLNVSFLVIPFLVILSPLILPFYFFFKGEEKNKEDNEYGDTTIWKEYDSIIWDSYQDYYEEYLDSDVWERKRAAVMERADGSCESIGCSNPATEVHHRTYPDDLGSEPLSFLKALCRPCHSEQHPEKPKGYMTAEEAQKAIDELVKGEDS